MRHVYAFSVATLQPSASLSRPRDPAYGPRTLSSGSTTCSPNATVPASSILRPRSGNRRPANDISRLLSGGPSACDAADEAGMVTLTSCGCAGLGCRPCGILTTRAVGSRPPLVLTP